MGCCFDRILDTWRKTMDSIIKGCVNCKINLNKGDIVGISAD